MAEVHASLALIDALEEDTAKLEPGLLPAKDGVRLINENVTNNNYVLSNISLYISLYISF